MHYIDLTYVFVSNQLSYRNKAVADYLKASGYHNAYTEFQKEAELVGRTHILYLHDGPVSLNRSAKKLTLSY